MNEDREARGSSSRTPEDRASEMPAAQAAVDKRMSRIRHKIMVLSGKGGVGKSTVAANLAYALALKGKRVGVLDVDVHGPSLPKLLGLEGRRVSGTPEALVPVEMGPNLRVMSIGFFLRQADDALIWRGPLKANLIRQFLSDVEWGDLDYLVIDSPPGTGDEPLSVGQLLPDADGALIVTTPQGVALADVRKSIAFCRKLRLPVLGVIENMSGFICPHCGNRVDIFKTGGGEEMARDVGVRFLGRIPLDPDVVELADLGKLVFGDARGRRTAESFLKLAEALMGSERNAGTDERESGEVGTAKQTLRIAVPVAENRLCAHFGHCEEFALIDVDRERNEIVAERRITPPPHEPGVLPRWLAEAGAGLVVARGMGQRAQSLFREQGIEVMTGAPSLDPATIVKSYLDGSLEIGDNACDH